MHALPRKPLLGAYSKGKKLYITLQTMQTHLNTSTQHFTFLPPFVLLQSCTLMLNEFLIWKLLLLLFTFTYIFTLSVVLHSFLHPCAFTVTIFLLSKDFSMSFTLNLQAINSVYFVSRKGHYFAFLFEGYFHWI